MSDLEDETVLNNDGGDEHDETEELEERPRKHSHSRRRDEDEDDEEDEDEEEEEEDEGVERGKKRSKVRSFPRSRVLRMLTCERSIVTTNAPLLIVSLMLKPRLTKMKTKRKMKTSMREVRW